MKWVFFLCSLLIGSASAQTVTPLTFGLNLKFPSTTKPAVLSGGCRLWNAQDAVGTDVSWAAIETARGTYVWSQLDAQVAICKASGQKIYYTFGNVPGWANGNAAAYVPPTSATDFYNFVTAIALRYAGDGITYSVWNEANLPTFWWGGTVAQMVTYAQNVFAIVHANDPTGVVATPSVTSSGGFLWMQQFLAAGGGAYADAMDIHAYPIRGPGYSSVPPTSTPEANSYIAQQFATVFAFYGQGSKPVIADEGGWANDTISALTTSQKQAYASIWLLSYASAGFAMFAWYEYDDSAWGTLWNGGTWLDQAGIAFRQTQNWLNGATFTAPWARVATTNQIRNPTGTGMVAGTPGTPPTDWSVFNPDSANGISTQFVGTCTGGVVWRVFGTATAGATGFVQLSFETSTHIAATQGQQWTAGLFAQLISGAVIPADAQTVLEINETGSGGGFLDTALYFFFNPIPATPLSANLQSFAAKTVNAAVAFVVPLYSVTYSVGDTLDISMCIGTPTMDTGSIWKATMTLSGGSADVVEDSAGGPTTFSTSHTQQANIDSSQAPVVGGTVTLTNWPKLLSDTVFPPWAPGRRP